MTPETNPIPSQNALKRAEIIEQIANKWLPDMETPSLDARYISLKAAIEETLHAAEQRGMEKVADEVERLRAENASLRAEIERLISQTVAVPRLDR